MHVCVCVYCRVDSSPIACSWITFLPVCLILFSSSTRLDFLLWDLRLFEEAYSVQSLESCHDQPWTTNTSKGSKVCGPNISSITELTLWGFALKRHRGANSLSWKVFAVQMFTDREDDNICTYTMYAKTHTHRGTIPRHTHKKGWNITITGMQTDSHTSSHSSDISKEIVICDYSNLSSCDSCKRSEAGQ